MEGEAVSELLGTCNVYSIQTCHSWGPVLPSRQDAVLHRYEIKFTVYENVSWLHDHSQYTLRA